MDSSRFTKKTIEVLAKRAGNFCSNPDCNATTAGPAVEPDRAMNVGEAAHIHGVRPGSARYRQDMSDDDRADITNAIWLCCTCHTKIDADANQYPVELLFEWRRSHEAVIGDNLGKAGAVLRQKVLEHKLAPFAECGYLAQQIIIDKPKGWEYRLTVEILRRLMEPTQRRWRALQKGLYALPSKIITEGEYTAWMRANMQTITGQNLAITTLVNEDLQQAWGPPGQPGSEHQIYWACRLLADACARVLEWEETVRFVVVPERFEELQTLVRGVSGPTIDKVFHIPQWMNSIISSDTATGPQTLSFAIDLPENWSRDVEAAAQRAVRHP